MLLDLASLIFEEQQSLEVILKKIAATIISFMQVQKCTIFIVDEDCSVSKDLTCLKGNETFILHIDTLETVSTHYREQWPDDIEHPSLATTDKPYSHKILNICAVRLCECVLTFWEHGMGHSHDQMWAEWMHCNSNTLVTNPDSLVFMIMCIEPKLSHSHDQFHCTFICSAVHVHRVTTTVEQGMEEDSFLVLEGKRRRYRSGEISAGREDFPKLFSLLSGNCHSFAERATMVPQAASALPV